MGKDRETFKHAAIYSSAAILGKLIGFLMLPFYAHILRDIGYGVIGMIESTMTILVSLLAHGLRGAIIRIYHEEEGENKQKVISTGVLLLGAVTLVMVGLTMLASRPLSQLLLGDPAYYKLLCLALGGFFFDLTGQAAGATLLIERAAELTNGNMSLHVERDNDKAIRLYQKMGFDIKYHRMQYRGAG